MAGYSSDTAPSAFVEVAELVFPLVFSFGSAWRIGLNGARFVPLGAFTAGLFAGPVHVACDPGAELVQVDLTPCGAAQIFGGAAAELSGQVMPLEDIPPFAGRIHDLLEARECPIFCVTGRRSMLRRKDSVDHGKEDRQRRFGRTAKRLRAA